MFKAVKALRTVKIVNIFVEGANILIQLKTMIQRIFICFPIIIKLVPIIMMVFYIWAIIGMENFNKKTHSYRQGSPYEEYHYADFSNFLGATALLF